MSYLDVSNNGIRNLTWLNEASGVYTYPLRVSDDDNALSHVALTAVEFSGNPATCRLVSRNVRRRLDHFGRLTFALPALQRICECSSGYSNKDGICLPAKFWLESPGALAGFTFLCLFIGGGLMLTLAYLYRRFRWYRRAVSDQRLLINEKDQEIDVLKKAWELDEDEIELLER